MAKRVKNNESGNAVIGIIIILFVIGVIAVYGMKFILTYNKEKVVDFGFKNVGELVTQEWYGRIVEDSSKDRKLFNVISMPMTNSRLVFSIDVEVLAGINFEDIKYSIKDETITIELPKAEVYKSYEINDSYIEYIDDESWYSNLSGKEREKLKSKVVEKGKEEAIKSNLLTKASDNAKNIITNVIKSNPDAKDFKIVFK